MSEFRTDPTHLAVCAAADALSSFEVIKEHPKYLKEDDREEFDEETFDNLKHMVDLYESAVRFVTCFF